MADYRIIPVDLTAALDRSQIVPNNNKIYNVSVLTLPAGASLQLHFGQRQGIPVVEGDEMGDPQGCAIENDGLFVTAPAQPGVVAQLYVGMSSAEVTR